MPAYDSKRFDPPAPLAYVTLRNPETGSIWKDVQMLLDYWPQCLEFGIPDI